MFRNIRRTSLVLMVVSVLVGVLWPLSVHGQEDPTVALIVVDDFDRSHSLITIVRSVQFSFEPWNTELSVEENHQSILSQVNQLAERLDPDLPDEGLCAVNLAEFYTDGTGHYVVDGTSSKDWKGEATHGELVEGVALSLLGNSQDPAAEAITVSEADTEGYEMSALLDAIETAKFNVPDADLYVVNMSFAIIPCNTLDTFAAYEKYIHDADLTNDIETLQYLIQSLFIAYQVNLPARSDLFDNDLFLYFQKSTDTVAVAASGNMGLCYAFYPAAWPSVISVSGSDVTAEFFAAPYSKSSASNCGEILMPQLWVYSPTETLTGTSFAAPRLSVAIALYLAKGGTLTQCLNPSNCANDPDPLTCTANEQNMDLDYVLTDICQDMAQYFP